MPIDAMVDHYSHLGPCLHWGGKRTSLGYGQVFLEQRAVYAHRLSYCDANGVTLESISDKVVRHKCDTPSCFNPAHLEIGTQADNLADMRARGRAGNPNRKGEANGSAKLTAKQVAEIKALYVRGSKEFGCPALGRKYGLHLTAIHRIVTGSNWSHVEREDAD